MSFLNLAFYHFARLEDPFEWRRLLREYCAGKPFKGTILFGTEGINGMMSGEEPALRELQAYLGGFPHFSGMEYKESRSSEIAFPRMLVKVKKEIIPLGLPDIDPARETGARLAPAELKRWLDENRDITLLDTRNDYEIEHGTFKHAVTLPLGHFRDFPAHLAGLPEQAKAKPLVMFCTGGIRCEKASVVAMRQGFREVYQLDGGILRYFEECGGAHFDGNCFVFDKRVAVDSGLQEVVPTPPRR